MVNIAQGQPIWNLAAIQVAVVAGNFSLVNRLSRRNFHNLGWKTETLAAFLLALKSSHYRKSFLQQGAYDGHKLLDVDAYKMNFNEETCCEGSSGHVCIWVKLCLEALPSGDHVAAVTFHLDGLI
jgi:hypothetical protein